jgi:hypothetical protein
MSKMNQVGELALTVIAVGAISCAVLLSGCGAPDVPVQLKTSRHYGPVTDEMMDDELRDLMDEAFGHWGVTYTLSKTTRHSGVQINLIDVKLTPGGAAGNHSDNGPCRQEIWVHWDVNLLKHELGHAFGVKKHSSDPWNIMHWSVPLADDVTDKQFDRAQLGASLLGACG